MIELMSDLPEGVIGFTVTGRVTGEDYERVVIPTVEAQLREHSHLSMIYHLGEGFTGFDAAAAWDDTKIGMKHLTAWDRVAVVTDVDWLRNASRAFGFVMPCKLRVFPNAELAQAREWASASSSGLTCEFLPEQGVAVIEPHGRLRAADFERAAAEIDPHVADKTLNGLMIRAESFPGWSGFAALVSHLRFVREHHKVVKRVALVTDGTVIQHLPRIARHFLAADVRHFPSSEERDALSWLQNG